MKLFENKVQEIKYKVLREVAIQTWKGNDVFAEFNEIASKVVNKDEPPIRCCIYKDRAVIAERIRLAIGGSKKNPNVVQVIEIACDECPEAGYVVTDLCRGCLAHTCRESCKRGAIQIDSHQHAHIDKAKCVSCGSCVYHCPFGATVDVSSIVDVIRLLKDSEEGKSSKAIAIVAPAIGSQFEYASVGQVITGIKKLGFHNVMEVAIGADMVAEKETLELAEKGFLTSSCCPAFVHCIEGRSKKAGSCKIC